MTSEIIYKGALRTEAKHVQSNTSIETDAPLDNQGKGERFSPSDLMATSLGSCMLTIMGIKARDMQIDLSETRLSVHKFMLADPRRIGKIKIEFQFPSSLNIDYKQKQILENAAHTCPVAKSIHPDIEVETVFGWN